MTDTFSREQLDQIVKSAVETATRDLTAKLEATQKNRDAIRREKEALLKKQRDEGVLRAADRMLKGEQTPPQPADRIIIRKGTPPSEYRRLKEEAQPADRIIIRKGTPPSEYRRLKEEAQRRGIPYEVESNSGQPAAAASSRVKYVETDAHFYANKAQLAALGVGGLNALAAQKGKRLILFKSPDDLPSEARAKHDRILAAGDPDSFVFEG